MHRAKCLHRGKAFPINEAGHVDIVHVGRGDNMRCAHRDAPSESALKGNFAGFTMATSTPTTLSGITPRATPLYGSVLLLDEAGLGSLKAVTTVARLEIDVSY